jgi:small multidrug resistance family-3 protein
MMALLYPWRQRWRLRGVSPYGPDSATGRSFALYGLVYIAASLGWLWAVKGMRPDRADLVGAELALIGAGVILWDPRG